ncbi:helix-turn-helix domain-containing protein [Streptomyces sp. NBC_01216]|uniref:helix-turn-helix domain-containing protein n=1 Tax=Streptomyces sp. NBC_01216 TaxID=2903778 RepID=UPI002E12D001|nr:helix-turn-helix domain-containing protein [Streptomyces sp. NBC_01216]
MRGTTVSPGAPCLTPREGEPPLHRLELSLPDAVPFAAGTFDTIGPLSRADFPHRHTFYEIVHVTAGTGAHVVDLAHRRLRPPQLEVILPGRIHHWEDADGLDGAVALFTEEFLLDHPGDREILRRLADRSATTLDGAAHATVGALMAELGEEYRRRPPGHETVLRSLLHVLLIRAGRLAGADVPASAPGRPAALAERFARLIAPPGPGAWSVRECAGRLGVTTGYLTEAVRTATGRTPGPLLREARVAEAQRLLARTELSVHQVAARAGFGDPAYFCRFFRRETGTTPGDFRKHHDARARSIEGPRGAA